GTRQAARAPSNRQQASSNSDLEETVMTHHLHRHMPIDLWDTLDCGQAIRLLGREHYIVRDHVFEVDARPRRLAETLGLWRRRYLTRRHRRQLGGNGLADIGIGPVEQDREAGKPFWKS